MLKFIGPEVWAFDCEWVPDPDTGKDIGLTGDDEAIVQQMWNRENEKRGEDEGRPFLPTVLCRVVSIAAVCRDASGIRLTSLPRIEQGKMTSEDEEDILRRFLGGVAGRECQLVGFNSSGVDVPILAQRAMRHGLQFPPLCPPGKPWEGRDVFSSRSDWHVDLMQECYGWGKKSTLAELAACCRVPGKLDTSGDDVYDLWLDGKLEDIVHYNEWDALTTYLIWLRAAAFVGLVDLVSEENKVTLLLQDAEEEHLTRYLEAWEALR